MSWEANSTGNLDGFNLIPQPDGSFKYQEGPTTKLPTIETKSYGSPEYLDLLHQMAELHERKNQGYAAASSTKDPWYNFRQCETFGIPAPDGVITRMSDKWSRLQSLWLDRENDKVGESIEDTLMDLAAYSLILICLLREEGKL